MNKNSYTLHNPVFTEDFIAPSCTFGSWDLPKVSVPI